MVIRVTVSVINDSDGKDAVELFKMQSAQKAPVFLAIFGDDGKYHFARPQSAPDCVTMDDVFAYLQKAPDQQTAAAYIRKYWPDIDGGLLSTILGALAAKMAGEVAAQ